MFDITITLIPLQWKPYLRMHHLPPCRRSVMHHLTYLRHHCIIFAFCMVSALYICSLLSYSLCSHLQYFNSANFPINLFPFTYLSVSAVRQPNEYEIVTGTRPIKPSFWSHFKAAASALLKTRYHNSGVVWWDHHTHMLKETSCAVISAMSKREMAARRGSSLTCAAHSHLCQLPCGQLNGP